MKEKDYIKFMKEKGYKQISSIKDADIEIYDGMIGEYLYFRRKRK